MDAGLAGDRFFLNAVGFGFDADVLKRTEKFKKRFNGMLPYMLGVIQTLFSLRPLPMRVRTEEEVLELSALILVAGNGRYIGGGMMPAPKADPFDGKFDVCIVRSLPWYRIPPCCSGWCGAGTGACPRFCFFAPHSLWWKPPGGSLWSWTGRSAVPPPLPSDCFRGPSPFWHAHDASHWPRAGLPSPAPSEALCVNAALSFAEKAPPCFALGFYCAACCSLGERPTG